MAGIVGWVGWNVDEETAGTRFSKAMSLLCHGARFGRREMLRAPGILLGVVQRREPPAARWRSPDGGTFVLVYGRPLIDDSGWRPAAVDDLGRRYLEHGIDALARLDGSFSVAIVDRRADRVLVATDRMGSMPVLHAAGARGVAFAPEAKALFGLAERPPRLDPGAAVSFLNLGYPVGEQTLFEGVHQLPPGGFLEIDGRGGGTHVGTYWRLQFAPRARWRAADAAEAVDAAMEEAHAAVVADRPERTSLLLTGGYDSRTVLGYLCAAGNPPAECVTWGVDGELPGSDPFIARRVAEHLGVRHRFLRYGAERLVGEAARWVRVGELSSDNFGNYAAGADFFEAAGVDPEAPVLIGDQMLGPGGFPADVAQAVANVTKVPAGGVVPDLATLMGPARAGEAGSLFNASVAALVDSCPSSHPKDVQDYLFFHLYVVRWLLAPAYFREPMVSPRRPMLLAPVVETGLQLPRRYRVDKAVLVALLRKRFPDLARYPIASAHSLVDWELEARTEGSFRTFLEDLLAWESLEATPLGSFLDAERCGRRVAAYFSEVPKPVDRRPTRLPGVMAWRRRLAGLPVVGAPVRAVEPLARRLFGMPGTSPGGAVLRRMALLSLLQRMIDDGTFETDTGVPRAPAEEAREGATG